MRMKLKVNALKKNVISFERKEVEMFDFNTPYRVI